MGTDGSGAMTQEPTDQVSLKVVPLAGNRNMYSPSVNNAASVRVKSVNAHPKIVKGRIGDYQILADIKGHLESEVWGPTTRREAGFV
jgi:hypothetical protein